LLEFSIVQSTVVDH